MNKCEAINKYITVNYKHGGTKMSMATKNMEKPTIKVPKVPEEIVSRVDILFGKTSTNNLRGRRQTSDKKKKTYSLLLQHFTP